MVKAGLLAGFASVFTFLLTQTRRSQSTDRPETVAVHNGPVTLHALVWRPHGQGRSPPSCSTTAGAAPPKNWKGSDHTKVKLKHLDRCSPATAMSFCFSSGRALGCPPARARAPLT